jgi:hypothetical protein
VEQLITVATFNEPEPAEVLKDRLDEAGMHADVMDESSTQAALFVGREPRAHMRVRVRKEEFDHARQLVAGWEPEGVMAKAVRCPQCGSSRLEYPQFSRRTAGSVFFALLSAAHLIPREYYCEDCQFTWPDKVALETPRDTLNWPHKSRVP